MLSRRSSRGRWGDVCQARGAVPSVVHETFSTFFTGVVKKARGSREYVNSEEITHSRREITFGKGNRGSNARFRCHCNLSLSLSRAGTVARII